MLVVRLDSQGIERYISNKEDKYLSMLISKIKKKDFMISCTYLYAKFLCNGSVSKYFPTEKFIKTV